MVGLLICALRAGARESRIVRYQEHPPSPDLAPFVRCIWELEAVGGPEEPAGLERVLPDGCMELVFHLGTPFRRLGTDGILRLQETALLVGVATRAVVLSPSERSNVIGVRFHPGGATFLGGPPADRWTDVIAPLEALADSQLAELSERLASVGPGGERVRLLDAFFSERARTARRTPLVGAAASICRGIPIDAVAADCALSTRQLQRRFRAEVGIGPKLLARIARFQRALRLGMTSGWHEKLTRLAHRSGYADQAHFARDFREFAGVPASGFRREQHAIVDAFVTGTDAAVAFVQASTPTGEGE